MRTLFSLFAVTIVVSLAIVVGSRHADAGGPTFEVDTTDDDPTKVACTAAANDCSLRGAITTANTSPSINTIELGTGLTYVLDEAGANDDLNQTGDLDILEPVTIHGNDSTVDANSIDRVFNVDPATASDVVITELAITGGNVLGIAGGILVDQNKLVLQNVTVDDNHSAGDGGGIWVGGSASLEMTVVAIGNNSTTQAGSAGGGIFKGSGNGSILIQQSQVFDNSSVSPGGGLRLQTSSSATITDSDFSGNTSLADCGGGFCYPGGGGIAAFDVDLTITGGSFETNHVNLSTGGAVGLLGGTLTVDGTTFAGNTAFGAGAIIAEEMNVTGATFTNNSTTGTAGAIYLISGSVTDTTIEGNHAGLDGGGIATASDGNITHSAIVGNTADGNGGGVVAGSLTPSIDNSTISGNSAAAAGGGIYRSGTINTRIGPAGSPPGPMTLTHVTIASNTAPDGANVFNSGNGGAIEARGSIVADPVTGPNCNLGALDSHNYNVEDADTCGFNDPNDQVNANADLQPLANNGGPTETQELGTNSDAVDLVTAGCPPPTDDQRGTNRPAGNACDAGAYESNFSKTPSPTPTGGPSQTPTPTPSGSPGTGTPTETATPTLSPGSETPTPGPGVTRTWGDDNCSGEADPVDSLVTLRFDAGLSTDTGDCPDMGEVVEVGSASPHPWGDIDCGGDVNPVDSLKLLRYDAGLEVAQEPGCPEIGSEVQITTS